MADAAISEIPIRKKRSTNKRALKQKNPSTNDENILAQTISQSPPAAVPVVLNEDPEKENHGSLSQPRSSPKKNKGKGKPKSLESDLQELQEMLQKMKLEKEKTEGLLKEKDEILKAKEVELVTKGREQERLQLELQELHKLKEIKPTVTLPVSKKKKKKTKKKKEGPEMSNAITGDEPERHGRFDRVIQLPAHLRDYQL